MSIHDGFYYYWDKYVVSPYCSTYDSTMFRFWLNCHQIEAAGENLRSADQSTKLYMKARIVGREDVLFERIERPCSVHCPGDPLKGQLTSR